MLATMSKLPRFLDYLHSNYRNLYSLYSGRLVELFPCYDGSANNLAIADEEDGEEESNNFLMRLWKQFQ